MIMRCATIVLALVVSATAIPAPDTPWTMIQRFHDSEECKLPDPGQSCSGAARKDVIVQYGKNQTQDSKDLFLNAAKAAGADVHQVMNTFGFTAFIPDSVVSLIKAHGTMLGLKVLDNGCTGIPWCGEAPC